MRVSWRGCLSVAAAVLLLGGCANRSENALLRYASNCSLDFLDIFEIRLEAGPSFRASAEYGIGIAGIGSGEAWGARIGRRSMTVKSDSYTFAPVPFPLGAPLLGILYPLGWYEPKEALVEVTLGHGTEAETAMAGRLDGRADGYPPAVERIACLTRRQSADDDGRIFWPGMFPLGGEAMWLIGARVRVYPVEIADFLTGLFGVDLARDSGQPARAAPSAEAVSVDAPASSR